MRLSFLCFMSAVFVAAATEPRAVSSPEIRSERLKAWQRAEIRPVAPSSDQHSIHAYFNACPESPDGRYVMYFSSSASDGEKGDIRILERVTGKEKTLAANITTEDAHRVACQQWLAGGRKVAFHDFRDGRWIVVAVDVETSEQRVLAEERQIGFGASQGIWAPIYGYHWKQGAHRDIEIVNVDTGEIRTAVKISDVLKRYGKEVRELVGEGEVSLFFPVMSPDGEKVMFKVARGSGSDDFRSKDASKREGKFVYDLSKKEFLGIFERWGHPAWSPDSAHILEKGIVLQDLETKTTHKYAPGSPSNHQNLSPDGKLFVADAEISKWENGRPNEWGIVVGSLETGEFATIYRFQHVNGANSWRKPHPHPVFSEDGKRIYFNVSEGGWTRLFVAEIEAGSN